MEGRDGGGALRKLHIVYFLSRDGKIEQPHLIRVLHLNSNGVRLRDVKRWLSELRGREMPDSFAWSYKRRYKAGYIWQDLTADDLITPVSDDEYILKGSLLTPLDKIMDNFLALEKHEASANMLCAETLPIDDSISPKTPQAYEEPPVPPPASSSSSEDSTAVFRWLEERKRAKHQRSNEIVNLKSVTNVKRSNSKSGAETGNHRRPSEVLRNLFRCRMVETKDSVLRPPRRNRNDRKSWERKGGQGSTKLRERAASARYKPAGEPKCSQCGQGFRPEKLHSHMKSCRALREKRSSRSFNRE